MEKKERKKEINIDKKKELLLGVYSAGLRAGRSGF
jgi:hypothetical protein